MATPQKPGKNNYILVVFDSCRYDSFEAARPKTIRKLGKIERRWSYASWTAPSHYNLLTGLLPHTSPANVFASDYYKRDFLKYSERLGAEGIEFKSLIPKLYFPSFLKDSLGYRTHAKASLPVLNPKTTVNHGFDSYKLMEHHNDMRARVKEMTFSADQPSFYLLNVGETHYPYAISGRDYLKDIDWGRTRAYRFGLAGIYLNLNGRESHGIVDSGAEASALRRELAERSRVEG